ncbi:MAG: helix-turn-helix transcriptional regulator [Bacteroidales bacterium]|nr:helix-turn-helix transcriptional regulator [Bacteroidales bacterium]
MEDRLKLFLSMEGISASQFAAKMNVQRSGLSHLLSGRNKPSYDFLARMLKEYPDLNAEWLLLGIGKPYKNGIEKQSEQVFEDMPDFEEEEDQEDYPSLFAHEEPVVDTESSNSSEQENIIVNQKIDSSKINKIIILYDNGTYEVR